MPSSLQGKYSTGGRVHTPSRVAPSVGHHQAAARQLHLLTNPQAHPARVGSRFNSIGFFQISKCTTLPLAAVVNFVVVGELPSRRIMLCLAWLTVGIAVTTATDVQINPMGCVAAVLAVVSTVLNQVRQRQRRQQPELGRDGPTTETVKSQLPAQPTSRTRVSIPPTTPPLGGRS